MKIFRITLAAYGIPPLYPSDVRDFLINFLGYIEIHTKGSHHKFQKPNHPIAICSFNEFGEIKADSGFKNMLKQIGIPIPLFNKYWDNKKELLRKTRNNREQTLKEFFSNQYNQQEEIIPNTVTKDKVKLDKLINQVPFVKRFFQSIINSMPLEDAYENLYQYVLSTDSIKKMYLTM
jgi:predicted RNA binding protein YcfA (HicA-like mRNA interferase family)